MTEFYYSLHVPALLNIPAQIIALDSNKWYVNIVKYTQSI